MDKAGDAFRPADTHNFTVGAHRGRARAGAFGTGTTGKAARCARAYIGKGTSPSTVSTTSGGVSGRVQANPTGRAAVGTHRMGRLRDHAGRAAVGTAENYANSTANSAETAMRETVLNCKAAMEFSSASIQALKSERPFTADDVQHLQQSYTDLGTAREAAEKMGDQRIRSKLLLLLDNTREKLDGALASRERALVKELVGGAVSKTKATVVAFSRTGTEPDQLRAGLSEAETSIKTASRFLACLPKNSELRGDGENAMVRSLEALQKAAVHAKKRGTSRKAAEISPSSPPLSATPVTSSRSERVSGADRSVKKMRLAQPSLEEKKVDELIQFIKGVTAVVSEKPMEATARQRIDEAVASRVKDAVAETKKIADPGIRANKASELREAALMFKAAAASPPARQPPPQTTVTREPSTTRRQISSGLAQYVLADAFCVPDDVATGLHDTVPHFLETLDASDLGKKNPAVASNLKRMREFDQELTSIGLGTPAGAQRRAAMDAFCTKVGAEIGRMRPGDELLLPGGWSGGSGAGHAMFSEVRCERDGSFTFSVIDTGMKQHFAEWTDGTRLRHSASKGRTGIARSNMSDPSRLKNLLLPVIGSDWNGATKDWTHKVSHGPQRPGEAQVQQVPAAIAHLYGEVLDSLGGTDAGPGEMISAQRTGICAQSLLRAYVTHKTGSGPKATKMRRQFVFDHRVRTAALVLQQKKDVASVSMDDAIFLRRTTANLLEGAKGRRGDLGKKRIQQAKRLVAAAEALYTEVAATHRAAGVRSMSPAQWGAAGTIKGTQTPPKTLPMMKMGRDCLELAGPGGRTRYGIPKQAAVGRSKSSFAADCSMTGPTIPSGGSHYVFDVDSSTGKLVGGNTEENLFLASMHMVGKDHKEAHSYLQKALEGLKPGEKFNQSHRLIVEEMIEQMRDSDDYSYDSTPIILKVVAEGFRRDSNFLGSGPPQDPPAPSDGSFRGGPLAAILTDKVMRNYYATRAQDRSYAISEADERVIIEQVFGREEKPGQWVRTACSHPVLDNRRLDLMKAGVPGVQPTCPTRDWAP